MSKALRDLRDAALEIGYGDDQAMRYLLPFIVRADHALGDHYMEALIPQLARRYRIALSRIGGPCALAQRMDAA